MDLNLLPKELNIIPHPIYKGMIPRLTYIGTEGEVMQSELPPTWQKTEHNMHMDMEGVRGSLLERKRRYLTPNTELAEGNTATRRTGAQAEC